MALEAPGSSEGWPKYFTSKKDIRTLTKTIGLYIGNWFLIRLSTSHLVMESSVHQRSRPRGFHARSVDTESDPFRDLQDSPEILP